MAGNYLCLVTPLLSAPEGRVKGSSQCRPVLGQGKPWTEAGDLGWTGWLADALWSLRPQQGVTECRWMGRQEAGAVRRAGP